MSSSSGGSLFGGCTDDRSTVTLRRFISRTHREIVDGIRHDLYHLAILPFLNNVNQTRLNSASSVGGTDLSFLMFKKIWIQNKLSLIHHACPQRCDRETYLQFTAYAVYGLIYHRFKQENSILKIPIDLNQLLPAIKDEVVRETVYNIAFIYTLFCVFHTQIVTNDNLYESKKYTTRGKVLMKGVIKTDALLNKSKILHPFRLGFSDMKEISQSIDNISFLAPVVGKQALILWHQLLLTNSFHYCLESGPHHGNRWYNHIDLNQNSQSTIIDSSETSVTTQQVVNAQMNTQQAVTIDSNHKLKKAKAMEAVKRLLIRCTVMTTDPSDNIPNKTKALSAVQQLLARCTDINQSPISFERQHEQSELHATSGCHSRKKRSIDTANAKAQKLEIVGPCGVYGNIIVIYSICDYRLQLRRRDINPNTLISQISDNFINSQVYHDNSIDAMLQSDALYASHVLDYGNSSSKNGDSAILDEIKLKRKNYYEFKSKWRQGKDAGAAIRSDDVGVDTLDAPDIPQENEEGVEVTPTDVIHHSATPTIPAPAPTTRVLPVTTELQHSLNPNFADEFMESLIGPMVAEPIHASASNSVTQESIDANNALEQLVKTMSNVESSNVMSKKTVYTSTRKDNVSKRVSAIAAVQKLLDKSAPFPFSVAKKQGTHNTKKKSNSSNASSVTKPIEPVTGGASASRSSVIAAPTTTATTTTATTTTAPTITAESTAPTTVGPTSKGNMWKKINAIDSVSKLLQQATVPGNIHTSETPSTNTTNISNNSEETLAQLLLRELEANMNGIL